MFVSITVLHSSWKWSLLISYRWEGDSVSMQESVICSFIMKLVQPVKQAGEPLCGLCWNCYWQSHCAVFVLLIPSSLCPGTSASLSSSDQWHLTSPHWICSGSAISLSLESSTGPSASTPTWNSLLFIACNRLQIPGSLCELCGWNSSAFCQEGSWTETRLN